jgi:putative Mg2+ transporter-C (MgtC) family protein
MESVNTWEGEVLKLLLAVLVGGVIGLEREIRDKPAGFRTMILIAVGAALFTILSQRMAHVTGDPGRIAAQIVTGVGFLGAGTILRERRQVVGLTTAAAIWMVASLGMGAGMGAYRMTLVAAALVLIVLLAFAQLERWMDERRDRRTYDVLVREPASLAPLRDLASSAGLLVSVEPIGKQHDAIKMRLHAVGPREAHGVLTARLAADPLVLEFAQA